LEYGWERLYTVGMEPVGAVDGKRQEGKEGWEKARVGERVMPECRVGGDSATDENITGHWPLACRYLAQLYRRLHRTGTGRAMALYRRRRNHRHETQTQTQTQHPRRDETT
jgi:hypothetical protein